MNNIIGLSPKALRKAADIQEKIQSLQDQLNEILGGVVPTPFQATEAPTKTKKRKMSAAGRAAIAAAAKARWAKVKGTAPSAKPAPKRKMSAQGLANIRAGVAKRMAAQGNAVQKPKRKMTVAWRKALERAWAARRAKGKAATKA
jgi:hypothetical protein